MNYFDSDEFVFTNDKEGGINTGGITVNSLMMRKGLSPIKTLNTNSTNNGMSGGGDKVSNLFDNIVVPNWVYTIGKMNGGSSNSYEDSKRELDSDDDSVIGDDLHDTLVGLVEQHETKSKENKSKVTKKRIYKNGGTRKHKNTKKLK